MNDHESPKASDIPADEHLRDDVAPDSGKVPDGSQQANVTPGQTNAGQQVGGLASAANYGKEQDPDTQGNAGNPV